MPVVATVAGASRGRRRGGRAAAALADAEGRLSQISTDGHALLLPGGRGRTGSARLRFSLPDDGGGQSRWVVWIGRMPVDALVLQRGDWRSAQRDFFAPHEDEGVLPSGFQFPLPASLRGDVELDLHASATLRAALRVKVLRESEAMRVEQRGAALAAAIYAALFTLALLTLALYGAARDRIFLLFFGATTAALLLLAAENGHLYQLPVFGLLSSWRGQGIWALGLIYLASKLQLLQRYVDTAKAMPLLSRVLDVFSIALSTLAAICLLGLSPMDALLPMLGTAVWIAAVVLGLVLIIDGARRRVQMAWPIALLAVLAVIAAFTTEVVMRGRWLDPVWLRYAYQMVLVASAAVLAVGLISRISEYRNQRDRDQLARADPSGGCAREAARADLNTGLQSQLRVPDPGRRRMGGVPPAARPSGAACAGRVRLGHGLRLPGPGHPRGDAAGAQGHGRRNRRTPAAAAQAPRRQRHAAAAAGDRGHRAERGGDGGGDPAGDPRSGLGRAAAASHRR